MSKREFSKIVEFDLKNRQNALFKTVLCLNVLSTYEHTPLIHTTQKHIFCFKSFKLFFGLMTNRWGDWNGELIKLSGGENLSGDEKAENRSGEENLSGEG